MGTELPHIDWLRDTASPYRIDVLDCRLITGTMVSSTPSEEIAKRYTMLRAWDGKELQAHQFPVSITIDCPIRYPYTGKPPDDGPIFRSSRMEEKWDLYHHQGRIFAARSWTGDAIYGGSVRWGDGWLELTEVFATDDFAELESRCVDALDYLIKSHLYDLAAPHPLNARVEQATQKPALARISHQAAKESR